MLSFVHCVNAAPGEEASLEGPAVSGQRASEESDRDPASADRYLGTARGRAFPLRLRPRRQQPKAEHIRANAIPGKGEAKEMDSLESESVERAPADGTQGTSAERALKGTLQAIAQAGGNAGALVLEVLQGVGSLQMGPMGSLSTMGPLSTPVGSSAVVVGSTSMTSSASHTTHISGEAQTGEHRTDEDKAVGLKRTAGAPGKGRGKQKAPLVPLSTVAEETSIPEEMSEEQQVWSEEQVASLPKRRSLEILRSLLSHKVQAMALAVA